MVARWESGGGGVRVGAATVTDPSLSWIKLLDSSWGSSSGVTWDQLSPLSSLLALIERLSLFTTAAAAGLSLSLLGGEQNLSLHGNKLPTNHQPVLLSLTPPRSCQNPMSDSRRACAEMSTIFVSQLRLHRLKLPVPVSQLNQSCNRIQFQQVDQISTKPNVIKVQSKVLSSSLRLSHALCVCLPADENMHLN